MYKVSENSLVFILGVALAKSCHRVVVGFFSSLLSVLVDRDMMINGFKLQIDAERWTQMLKVKYRIIIIMILFACAFFLKIQNIICQFPCGTHTPTGNENSRTNAHSPKHHTLSSNVRTITNQAEIVGVYIFFLSLSLLFWLKKNCFLMQSNGFERTDEAIAEANTRIDVNILMNLMNRWESDALHGHGTLISERIERWIDKVTTYWTS